MTISRSLQNFRYLVSGRPHRKVVVSNRVSKNKKKVASKHGSGKQKQNGYPFELRFYLNKSLIPEDLLNKYGKKLEQDLGKTLYENGEKWDYKKDAEYVEDVGNLPKKIKDFLSKDLVKFMKFEIANSDKLTYSRAVFAKGKDYISIRGFTENPLSQEMSNGVSLASNVDVINQKSIWQHFNKIYPIFQNQLYDFVGVGLFDPNGQSDEITRK